jgi:hypothetical protein
MARWKTRRIMGDDSTGSAGPATEQSMRPPGGLGDPPDELEIDRIHSALAHPRRRYLCYELREGAEWTLTELATSIAAWENDVPRDQVTSGQREDVYVALYHAHVPKLADIGVVTFDRTRETVTVGEHADQLLSVLRSIGASADSGRGIHTAPS